MEPLQVNESVDYLRGMYVRDTLRKWGIPCAITCVSAILVAGMFAVYRMQMHQWSAQRGLLIFFWLMTFISIGTISIRYPIMYFARKRAQYPAYMNPWIDTFYERECAKRADAIRHSTAFFIKLIPMTHYLGFSQQDREVIIRALDVLDRRVLMLRAVYEDKAKQAKLLIAGEEEPEHTMPSRVIEIGKRSSKPSEKG